jgi:RNA polymerase sigma-70 factor, ECF subfamily
VNPHDTSCQSSAAAGTSRSADARLVEQLRRGDAEASHRFFGEYYPRIYRYLLWLAQRPELAEDLTQETFLRAWRHLGSFEDQGSLRAWLYRIAHREFLRSLRSQRAQVSLEEVPEIAAPGTAELAEATELREVIRKLPPAVGKVVILHYLQGYSCEEIAQIVGAPVTTIKYRLSAARAHLQRELGEGDLAYLNEPGVLMRRWAWLPLDQMSALEARLSMVNGRWSMVDGPAGSTAGSSPSEPSTINHQPPTKGENKMSNRNPAGMSRRRLLGAAGSAAAAAAAGLAGAAEAAAPQNPADVIDGRLTRKISLASKATALSDLCDQLRADTGVHLAAGPSVADEKVTLFCQKLPLREVMRQLSRPFGYTWLRSGTPGQYRYELVQDLRSQLLEEELRNRDRNTALLLLEREIERYRPYLDLSPDEALARAQSALPEEKPLLETLGKKGWGPAQMYFRLSASDRTALLAGQTISFSAEPKPGERALPPEVARSVLQTWRDVRLYKRGGVFSITGAEYAVGELADALPPAAVPEARARVELELVQNELGQFTLIGTSGYTARVRRDGTDDIIQSQRVPLATGNSHLALKPENGAASAHPRFTEARDPAFSGLVTLQPQPSCPSGAASVAAPGGGQKPEAREAVAPEARVTTADLLEALHRASGLPVVGDFYTRLYSPAAVSLREKPLIDALNQAAPAMRLRWNQDENWLEFRSTTFYDDRLKEVPNRLLTRWAAARQERGWLSLDDLLEIAGLPDAPLDGAEMAEGAKSGFGLEEWDLARDKHLRPHLRYLAAFTPAQRQEAMSLAGLPFARMSLAQQQQYLAFAFPSDTQGLQSLEELAGATLRVDYSRPGRFEWRPISWYRWVMPTEAGTRVPRPYLREPSREAALQAARRYYPEIAAAMTKAQRRFFPQVTEAQLAPQEEQIVPTDLDLQLIYIPGSSHQHSIVIAGPGGDDWRATSAG